MVEIHLEADFNPLSLVDCWFSPVSRYRGLPGPSEPHPVFPSVPCKAEGMLPTTCLDTLILRTPVYLLLSHCFTTAFPSIISLGPHEPALPVGGQTFVSQVMGGNSTPRLLVTATCRFALPSSITSMTSSGLDTNRSVHPWKRVRSGLPVETGKQLYLKTAKHSPISPPEVQSKRNAVRLTQQLFLLAHGLNSTSKRSLSKP